MLRSLSRLRAQRRPARLPRPRSRGYAAVTDLANYPEPGTSLHGFTLQRVEHVPELQLTAVQLQHRKTGADYLHIARDDKNNVFSIGFKTNPPDDTGVPHILEHTTLCGSQSYPVRDPFFKMLPRSLSNFMNAFTASDHTFYPFATTNEKDFKNLLAVYLDATLHPLLKKDDFAQEGWRIGPENTATGKDGKAASELVFKGVVYNEMKGQMSNAAYLYYTRYQDHIFPDINNSGGDPQKITDLTYEGLRAFHAKNYHPSNAKIFTYGNMPLADHLQEVGRQLEQFEMIRAENSIKAPIQLTQPVNVVVKGPIDPLVDAEMQYKTSTSWVLGSASDVVETFALGVMSSLLMDGYGSPLYRALIESSLGPDFSPNTGFEVYGKTGIFAVGLNGVRENDVSKVKTAIEQTLKDVHQRGFEQHKIEGILHQLELGLKHKTANFGMNVMQRLKPSWFNGVDPFESLAWNKTVDEFKRRIGEGRYLESLMEKYLLNDRNLTFTMEPSKTYSEDLVAEEKERLTVKIAEASEKYGDLEKARVELASQEVKLEKIQEDARHQPLDCLPMVHVSDIPRSMERKPVRDSVLDAVKIQWREAPTNGLTYFRAVYSFDDLPSELRSLVPLFCDAIMRLGTKDKSMEELEDLIKQHTGGISTSYFSKPRIDDFTKSSEGMGFSGFALDQNVPQMYELLRTLLQETDFDGPRAEEMIRQLLQAHANGALDAVASAGHRYARRYAESKLSLEGSLVEQTAGLTQVQFMSNLASRPNQQSLADVIALLKTLQRAAIANTANLRVALTCGSESVATNEAALHNFLSKLPPADYAAMSASAPAPATTRSLKTFFPLPYQVYYSALALPTVPYISPDSPALSILSQLLTHKHLHHEIREKGGAYGGGAYSLPLSGSFGFTSYRDPNPQRTHNVMLATGPWAVERTWTAQELDEAKLGTFQSVDAPESVNQEGMARFLSGIDEDLEQRRREQLLDVTAADVQRVAHEYLVQGAHKASVVVLGEQKEWVDSEGWEVKRINV